jgi:hypothetical protein
VIIIAQQPLLIRIFSAKVYEFATSKSFRLDITFTP